MTASNKWRRLWKKTVFAYFRAVPQVGGGKKVVKIETGCRNFSNQRPLAHEAEILSTAPRR
jgi:hypothetical protein